MLKDTAPETFQDIAQRSWNLPVEEVIHIIDQGFTPEVGKYTADRWEHPADTPEDPMDRYARYVRMVGAEEFQALSTSIAALRVIHRVCSGCGDSDRSLLRACAKCRLTYYCSRQCQRGHWADHATWCARRFDGVRDAGHARTVLHDKRKCISRVNPDE